MDQPKLPLGALRVLTPLKVQSWSAFLAEHPDKDFVQNIIRGITNGFRIGFDYTSIANQSLHSAKRNMQSAREHAQVIDEYLQDECSKQRVAGPYSSAEVHGTHINRFGVIPKKSQPNNY